MHIFDKKPYTKPELIYVDSTKMADLILELDYPLLMHNNLGRGYFLLAQERADFDGDEPNIIYEGRTFYGKIFIIKAGKAKMLEMTMDDLIEIEELIEL
ncbi:MAG: hypothetical protein IBX70_07715 [Clostridia bacterium]|nr:hypothetical protein [Clostridia bacterium]